MKPILLAWAVATAFVASAARDSSSAAAQPAGAGFVTMGDGVRLYYERVGDGSQLVIVPGRLFLRGTLAGCDPLRRGRTLLFYDMRNRGKSDAVADVRTLNIDQDVKDLEAVRQHFGAETPSLIGYSYLGRVVVMYALAHPGRVARLVQLGPIPMAFGTTYAAELTQDDEPDVLAPKALEEVRALRKDGFHLEHPQEYCEKEWAATRAALYGDPGRAASLDPGSPCAMPNEWPVNLARHFEHHFQSVQRHAPFAAEDAARVRVPVLTIHGSKDRNAPYGAGREWALRLPDARLLTVDGAGHNAFIEAAGVVLPAIATFLDGRWPEGVEKVTDLERRGRPVP